MNGEIQWGNLSQNLNLEKKKKKMRGLHLEGSYIDWLSRSGVDGTGSGSCPMADFGIGGVEPSGSATR
jgi:hypothetical protein